MQYILLYLYNDAYTDDSLKIKDSINLCIECMSCMNEKIFSIQTKFWLNILNEINMSCFANHLLRLEMNERNNCLSIIAYKEIYFV